MDTNKIGIAHIGIYTMDIERMKNYYVKYFGAEFNEKYDNGKGFSSYFLTLGYGARLEIMANTRLIEHASAELESGIKHIAISVGGREAVRELTERITADGYMLYSPCRDTGDGYFESVVADPDGNAIEITI